MPPEERRAEDRKITELQIAIARVETSLLSIKEAREKSHDETASFRHDLKLTIETMRDTQVQMATALAQLPCGEEQERIGNFKNGLESEERLRKSGDTTLHKRVNDVWAFIIVLCLLVVGGIGGIAWGGGHWVGSIAERVSTHGEWIKDMTVVFHNHELQEISKGGIPALRAKP